MQLKNRELSIYFFSRKFPAEQNESMTVEVRRAATIKKVLARQGDEKGRFWALEIL